MWSEWKSTEVQPAWPRVQSSSASEWVFLSTQPLTVGRLRFTGDTRKALARHNHLSNLLCLDIDSVKSIKPTQLFFPQFQSLSWRGAAHLVTSYPPRCWERLGCHSSDSLLLETRLTSEKLQSNNLFSCKCTQQWKEEGRKATQGEAAPCFRRAFQCFPRGVSGSLNRRFQIRDFRRSLLCEATDREKGERKGESVQDASFFLADIQIFFFSCNWAWHRLALWPLLSANNISVWQFSSG